MSRSAEIDFSFYDPVEVSGVLRRLEARGVVLKNEGEVSYILDSDDMFDWVRVGADEFDRVLLEVDAASSVQATFVVSALFEGTDSGGEIIFHKGRTEVSFSATVNRRYVAPGSHFCDFGWYLDILVPALESLGLRELEARDYK
ncbi:hypothetical protein [Streptomyces cavernicola]|uniref:Uncharacterized protein n=1 Tax=Streptomyces cavernicola TaxID=3043613 RepID=A0ABT6SLI8_9ACTN|nr:hypothetical protein [Streptomyces sp. B-S-A6]MDI3409055.1 hypothetical protein [Streptomyces sp. B-S-A6]